MYRKLDANDFEPSEIPDSNHADIKQTVIPILGKQNSNDFPNMNFPTAALAPPYSPVHSGFVFSAKAVIPTF